MGNGQRFGVMGGAFDPIHYGHLVTAEEALSQFNLDKIIFMPTGQPPHKEARKMVVAEERYLMTVMATASHPQFSVSRYEIDKPAPSYTIDTVEALKRSMAPSSELYFITGADAVLEILTWKEPHKLAKYCSFIAATRPGYDLSKLKVTISDLKERGIVFPDVHFVEVPALAISSTDIRKRVNENRPITFLLPHPVANYIKKEKFYMTNYG